MGRHFHVLLVFLTGCFLLETPIAAQHLAQPDSLRQVLHRTTADTARVRVLLLLSDSYLKSDSVQAWKFARQALALAQQHQHTSLLPKIFGQLGQVLEAQNKLPKALQYYHRARRVSLRLGLLSPLTLSYRSIAKVRGKQDRNSASRRALWTALAVQRRVGDTLQLAKIYSDLGVTYQREGDFPKTLQAYLQALRLSEQRLNREYAQTRIRTLRNLSAFFSQQNDSVQDLYYLQQTRRLLHQYPDPITELSVLADFGAYHVDHGHDSVALHYYQAAEQLWKRHGSQALRREPADIFLGLGVLALRRKEFDTALTYLTRAAVQYQRAGKHLDYIEVLYNVAEVYRQQGRYALATDTAVQALVRSRRAGYENNVANSYKLLADIRAAASDSAAAFRYHVRYQALHDSLFNQEKAQQLATLSTRYETQKKEAQISWLQRSMAWQKRARNLLGGALLAVGLVGAAAYWRYRLERRARHQLQAKEVELAARNQQLLHTQERLHHSLDEKEVLLKEVHHRVKNNLQVIASRLALQALGQRADPAVTAALRDGQNWIKSIALIHEMLYQSNDLASVEFQPFLEQLVAQLSRTFADNGAGTVAVEVYAPGVRLGTNTAIPLGLIINELLSNAYKYAFPSGRTGQVRISLTPEDVESYHLCVTDNGVGLPTGFSLENTASLGLRLVSSLAGQLEGTLEVVHPAVGTEFHLTFQEITEPLSVA